MSKSIVYSGQSFFDKVIENTGSIENAVEMALLNEISITDNIVVGSGLLISTITNKVVAGYFDDDNKPASLGYEIAAIESYDFPLGGFPFSF